MQLKLFALLIVSLISRETIADSPSSGGSDGGPRPPANWKPTGRVLLLPARQQTAHFYGPPPAEFTARQLQSPEEYDEDALSPPPEEDAGTQTPFTEDYPTTTSQTDESSDGFFFNTGDQLKQSPQVTSGVYHVLLPDGRLQRVEYTTAPLKQAAYTKNVNPSQGSNQFSQQNVEQTAFSQQNGRTGQASTQFSFQKPSFQSNQFALNSFKQNQHQENNLGQSSSQVPANGQYRTSHGSPSNSQTFYYQQQKEEPKTVASQTPSPKPLNGEKGSNKTTQSKPVFVSGHFGPTQGKPTVNGPTQRAPTVNGPTQGATTVNGQTQGKSFTSSGKVPAVTGQTVSSYTNPQPSYPSYTFQPIEFARQQEDNPASQFVFNGYLASVEYPVQQPVVPSSPVYYSYSSAPLVRILRRAD
ncbi:hypothetical protein LSTR_LSTR008875 [Laodelphax striatellus]|uniref:DUF4794 domain-containing protein n=1 Tax=Laodelphax striatellus TaxID=195883 RepID=A0A482WM66_LAOST|nr:hypothetical protein LSTR_LSTR008875 [Laodelphax striatellus]